MKAKTTELDIPARPCARLRRSGVAALTGTQSGRCTFPWSGSTNFVSGKNSLNKLILGLYNRGEALESVYGASAVMLSKRVRSYRLSRHCVCCHSDCNKKGRHKK
jgi:hypothetical protein